MYEVEKRVDLREHSNVKWMRQWDDGISMMDSGGTQMDRNTGYQEEGSVASVEEILRKKEIIIY